MKIDSEHENMKTVFYLKSLRLFLRILCIENELYFAPDKLNKFMNIIILKFIFAYPTFGRVKKI